MIDALDPGREGKRFLDRWHKQSGPSWIIVGLRSKLNHASNDPETAKCQRVIWPSQIKPIFSSRFANRPIAPFQYFLSDIGRYYLKKGHARCFISSNTYKFIENMLYVHFKHLISTFMLLSLPSIVSAGDDILHCPGPCEPHKLSCRIWGDPHVDDFV